MYGSSSYSDEKKTVVKNGLFTSCKINDNCPPWSIKAEKITHDKINQDMIYKNAILKVYDIPVLYYPKFFHPDPSVKRRSGFLKPQFNNSETLGSSLYIPYFKTLGHDMDITFKPTLFEKLKRFDKTIFFTTISYHQQTSGSHRISMEDLKKYQVLLITGIANPSSLLSFMDENKVNFSHCKFPDHHHFTDKDIQVINEQFAQLKSNKKLILTTEKDYVRLENRIEELSFLGIETTFLSEQEKFNSIIRKQLR